MNIIILGPQGSGKGTQAKLIVDKFNLFYMEMGGYLRQLAKLDPNIDKVVNERGKLLSDNLVFTLMSEYLTKKVPSRDNIIFDGYPRSVKQYELLKNWLMEAGKEINNAIVLEISEEESIKRLSARRIDKKTGEVWNLITNLPGADVNPKNLYLRTDDKPDAVKQRLKAYHNTTKPLIEVFEREGILIKLNGERPIKEIFSDIVSKLK
jgi:adenylate kinase